jgi:hypothetical protein
MIKISTKEEDISSLNLVRPSPISFNALGKLMEALEKNPLDKNSEGTNEKFPIIPILI